MKRITLFALAVVLIGMVCMAEAQVSLKINDQVISSGSVVITTGGTPPPSPVPCTYTINWGDCQVNGTETGTIFSTLPIGCTGIPPSLTRTCTYTPPPVPPGTRFLTLNYRNTLTLPIGETDYICRLDGSQTYRIHMDIIGLTNDVALTWTWTFPNGVVKTGFSSGTDNSQPLDVRYPTPIPAGDSLLKITATAPSSVVLWVQY